MNLKLKIREIQDFPIKGVNFKDITPLLEDKLAFRYVIDKLAEQYVNKRVDKIVAIDARGFILASPLAYKIGAGICLVRKKGKLPYKTIEVASNKEYGKDILTIHKETIKKGEKVIIVDDVLATGGTIVSAISLVEKLKGEIIGISVLIDLPFLEGYKKIKKYKLNALVSYDK